MNTTWNAILWSQFGAAIDMLENAIHACPERTWQANLWPVAGEMAGLSAYWYVAYHALFWLDLYLTGAVEGFAPPAPFTLDELDPAGLLPERPYTQDELLAYLDHDRRKCRSTLEALTDVQAWRVCKFTWGQACFAELLLDNMRHVQEHAAQLNLYLGQHTVSPPGWVTKTNSQLDDE